MNWGAVWSHIQEFLEIQIHHPAVACGLILLRLFHRLMCRSLGPKPIAVFRERSVSAPLQRLHHRLLDEPILHRNAQLAHPAVRLRDFHPFHWLWCVGSVEELFAGVTNAVQAFLGIVWTLKLHPYFPPGRPDGTAFSAACRLLSRAAYSSLPLSPF
jgi:hypothetical protein